MNVSSCFASRRCRLSILSFPYFLEMSSLFLLWLYLILLPFFQLLVTEEMLRSSIRASYAELLRETAQPGTSGIIRPPKLRRNVDAEIGETTIQAILDAEFPYQQGVSCDTYTNMDSLRKKPVQQNNTSRGKGGPYKGRSHQQQQKVSLDVGPVAGKPPPPPPPPGPLLLGNVPEVVAGGSLASTLQAKRSSLKPLAPGSGKLLSQYDESVKKMSDSLDRIQQITRTAMMERRKVVSPPHSSSGSPVHWSEESDGEGPQQRLI